MFELNLTYNQVLDIVRCIVDCERRKSAAMGTKDVYYDAKIEAYMDVLNAFYTDKEIGDMRDDL